MSFNHSVILKIPHDYKYYFYLFPNNFLLISVWIVEIGDDLILQIGSNINKFSGTKNPANRNINYMLFNELLLHELNSNRILLEKTNHVIIVNQLFYYTFHIFSYALAILMLCF